MDKRSDPRYATLLNALVQPAVSRSWLCTIQDFCSGGLLLVEQDAGRSRRDKAGIVAGETVGIHFGVPGEGKDQHFRLEGNIVRVMDSGVGIKFAKGMDDDAMEALRQFSDSQRLASEHLAAARSASSQEGLTRRAVVTPQAPQVLPEAESNNVSLFSTKSPLESAAAEATETESQPAVGAGEVEAAAAQSNLSQRPRHGDAAAGAGPVDFEAVVIRLPGPITPSEVEQVVGEVRRHVVRVLPEMISALFAYMDDELLGLARDAKSNDVQAGYFAAMSVLEQSKKGVSQSFNREILDQIDHPKELQTLLADRKAAELVRKQTEAKKTKLTLVDTDDFEDWLAIANITSRSERTYEKSLQEIRSRMGMLVDAWGHKDANPLGASVFCYAFDQAIHKVELAKDIRQRVYVGFEEKAVPLFLNLYTDITKVLEHSQLFPETDDAIYTSSVVKIDTPSKSTSLPSPPGVASADRSSSSQDDEQDEVQQAALEDAFEQSQSSGAVTAAIREELEELRNELREQRGAVPERRKPTDRRRQDDHGLGDVYSTVRNLLAYREAAQEGAEASSAVGNRAVGAEEVRGLLRDIQPVADRRGRVNVLEQLQQRISQSGQARQLGPEAQSHIDVVENLVDSIEGDAVVSGSAKSWIRQLELTLDKVATAEGNLLDLENPHASMSVINLLAKLGGGESVSMGRQIDQIVTQINQGFDTDPQVFDSALAQLAPLVDRQSRAFTGNVQRTVKASEGQQTLVNAQRAVVSELDQLLAGQRVPAAMMKQLMPGWRNLMVNTHLRQGKDSGDWQQQLQVLEQVVEHFNGTADSATSENYKTPEALLDQIDQGLDSISFEPGKRAPLLKVLRELIVDRKDLNQVATIEIGPDSMAETLGFSETAERDKRRKHLRAEFADNHEWQQCLERASRLYVGEWLNFTSPKGEDEIAIVAWTNTEHANYVFVNRRGVKTVESIVEDVASEFYAETARVLEEADIPLSDRASHRMLQNMHNQLTHQASHDDVTGLINRKEFERALSVALGRAKRDDSMHLVAYFDLDQFKVINNAIGHEAGDKLLKEIAEAMGKPLSDNGGVLSRLGGDEFGLLVEKCGKSEALELVKTLCQVIKAYAFNWKEKVYRLTASCGVMHVDKGVSSAQAILQCADAACFAAKDAGRDRTQVYEPNDSEMGHRRGVMDFVAQVDKALEDDRFELNCQMIAPIDKHSDEDVHYEILLTVLDDNNEPLPPMDFIIAAETYNRMGAIDRWVIAHAFEFIASNILSFSDLGAFSINISGNSLTEDDFMEFVLEQFKKTRVPTNMICFEITETAAVGSLDDAVEFIEKLQVLGVKFALDDFGTGMSSYSYLRSLPVDYLKIDGVFVKDLETNPNDYAVVKSINEIGHFMGKKTIAEYVENDAVLAILSEIGVDFAQGFGIGKKFPITELLKSG
ncbi:MAG: diguanylate cyclase (GGDEF)-like protein [Candidatus Azotimanducaceae bacterium]|jgi:diguanylate cyclase (GGDEF)-like protein